MALTLLTSQLIAAVVLFLSTLICGVMPTWVATYLARRNSKSIDASISSSVDSRSYRKKSRRKGSQTSDSLLIDSTSQYTAGCSSSHEVSRSSHHNQGYHHHTTSRGSVAVVSHHVDHHSTCSTSNLPAVIPVSGSSFEGRSGCGNSPALSSQPMESKAWKNTLSFLMNLGGGVLFATSVLHMLPEVRESFQQPPKSGENDTMAKQDDDSTKEDDWGKVPCGLPVTELLVSLGFFLIFLAEEVVHALVSHHNPLFGHNHGKDKKAIRDDEQVTLIQNEVRDPAYGSIVCIEDPHHHHHSHGSRKNQQKQQINSTKECDRHDASESSFRQYEDISGDRNDSNQQQEAGNMPLFRCLMIVFALSFHSIFDGLAIGLQDSLTHMLQLLLAISVHKLLIAFVVGLQIFSTTRSVKLVTIYMLPFSLMSPIGVIAAAYSKCQLSEKLVGILTGVSTGSLLYITFFEILFREKTSSKLPGLLQLFAVFLGFMMMAFVQSLTEHEH